MKKAKQPSAAWQKIFGGVNTAATSRSADEHTGEHPVMRKGKTEKDKAKGHVAYQKNRRFPSADGKSKKIKQEK